MKRILCLIISLVLSVSLIGCGAHTQQAVNDVNTVDADTVDADEADADTTDTDADAANADEIKADSADDATDEVNELRSKLLALPNVESVELLSGDDGEYLAQYMITFIQPLDWTDLSKGTFPQRVLLAYKGEDHYNSFEVSGYCLTDIMVPGTPAIAGRGELSFMFNCNCIMMEYRYFGQSKPGNAEEDCDKAEYWDYMTSANANSDFSNIIHSIQTILPGKSLFSGVSKGGYSTNVFCMYENDDSFAAEYKKSVMNYGKWDNDEQYEPMIDAYVSYDAPLCDGPQDPRFMKNLFETIGDQGYDAQTAQEYRNLVMEFMIEALKNRNQIQDWYYQKCLDDGNELRPYCTKEILYDVAVLEFATQFWQYGSDFSIIENVLSMPKEDDPDTEIDEADEYLKQIYELILSMNNPSTWSPSGAAYPYYVQATLEMGEHSLDFSYLRKELAARGLEDCLFVTEEMENNLLQKMAFSEDMLNHFAYSSELRDTIIEWAKTTTAPIMQIQGGCDTWNAVSLSTDDNPAFCTYVSKAGTHMTIISTLSPEDRDECITKLKKWLEIE